MPVPNFALLALLSPVCFAAVEMDVTVGLGGHAKLGAWAPVRVVLNNKGEGTRGELAIPPQDATDEASDYRVPVDVPPSSRRAFMMCARPRVAAADLRVEFRPHSGPKVVRNATCAWHDPRSRIVLVISRKAGGLGTISAVPITGGDTSSESYSSADSVVAYVTPDRSTGSLGLPDRPAGYEGVTAVVLRDISPDDFEDFERDALVAWVQSGGLLVIMSAPNIAELRDSFIEKLSPVSIRGQRVLPHLGALAEHFRQNVNYGQALVAATEAKPGATVLVAQDGLPLLASRPNETGMVYFCAADCTAPPLDSADQLVTEMWSDVLNDQHPAQSWLPLMRLRPRESVVMREGLSPGVVQLPILRWEAFALFGGYLLAYIVVLVAVNLLAKRLDRREWTGHATVLAIVVFSLGALYLGSSEKLAACRTFDAGVAALRSGSSVAWLEATEGIRSPAARAYNIAPAAEEQTVEYLWGSLRAPSWPVQEQAAFTLREMPVDLWGFGALRVQGPWRMGGRINTRLIAPDVDSHRVAVSIENETPYDLRWPFVLLPSAPVMMNGLIPKGSTRETDSFERSRFQQQPSSSPETVYAKLVKHCQAEDSRTAPSSEARIRHRLLLQLGAGEADSPRPSGSWFMPSPYQTRPDTAKVDPLAPPGAVFGAWVELPKPLLGVSPSSESHVSEILVLVDVPLDLAGPASSPRRFSDLAPSLDASTQGIKLTDEGNLTVAQGTHELRFRLSTTPRPQLLSALSVVVQSDVPGLEAQVYDYRNRQWRPVTVSQQGQRRLESLTPPGDYVRWPWVKVRLTHRGSEPATVRCALSGEFAQ